MRTKIQAMAVAAALLTGFGAISVFSQEDHGKMGKMAGKKMSHDEMMAKMEKMSTEDKAAMIDKMPVKDKKAAMKTSGMDVSKMSAKEKAEMFDKMPMDQQMTMMSAKESKNGKMGKHTSDK